MAIITKDLSSSALDRVTFDTVRETLTVKFTDGVTTKYGKVPFHVFETLINAESQGSFFNYGIRDAYPILSTTKGV